MHSALPKVLHRLAGRPLLAHVLAAVQALAPRRIVVVHGHGAAIRAAFADQRRMGSRPSNSAPGTRMQALPRSIPMPR
jgi:bifunctional UDP-N-acetylglucosamine pyrophosphorylase/glucosamine-1-phosphate N-acetyltransferase